MAIDEKGRAAMNCLTQRGLPRRDFGDFALASVSAIATIEPNPRPRGNSVDVNALSGRPSTPKLKNGAYIGMNTHELMGEPRVYYVGFVL